MSLIVEKFKSVSKVAGIDIACTKIGIDFCSVFIAQLENMEYNPYENHYWVVFPHSHKGVIGGLIIHAIPPATHQTVLPWEEWFSLNGELHHHILFPTVNEKCTDEVFITESDRDHPITTLDKRWYFYNDLNLTPVLY